MTHPTNNTSNRDTLRTIHSCLRFAGAGFVGYNIAKRLPGDNSVTSQISSVALATLVTLKGTEMMSPKWREMIAIFDAGFSAMHKPIGSSEQGWKFAIQYLCTRTLLTPTDELFPPTFDGSHTRNFRPSALIPLYRTWQTRTDPQDNVGVSQRPQGQQSTRGAPSAPHPASRRSGPPSNTGASPSLPLRTNQRARVDVGQRQPNQQGVQELHKPTTPNSSRNAPLPRVPVGKS